LIAEKSGKGGTEKKELRNNRTPTVNEKKRVTSGEEKRLGEHYQRLGVVRQKEARIRVGRRQQQAPTRDPRGGGGGLLDRTKTRKWTGTGIEGETPTKSVKQKAVVNSPKKTPMKPKAKDWADTNKARPKTDRCLWPG